MALKVAFPFRFTRLHLLPSRLTYCSYSDVPANRYCGNIGSSAEFESAIQSLKNSLLPERLTSVLDSTSDLNLALRIFRWASSQRMFVHTVNTYACMISKLGVVGHCDEMDDLLKEMIKLHAPALEKVLNDLIQSLSNRNRCDEMMRQGSLQLDLHLFTAFSRCLCENQLLDGAVTTLKEMLAAAHAPVTSTYGNIVDCYCTFTNFHEAVTFLEENDVAETEPYNVLLSALCKTGRLRDSVCSGISQKGIG